jgi:RimJ/RimL family protein N-acetyltransferase
MTTGERPTLETERLGLRPFTLEDAPTVQRLAGEYEVASTTLSIPHPYPEGAAERWISTHQERYEQGEMVSFAIVRRADSALVGAIGLHLAPQHAHAELGYWLGKPYWNQGYASEAAAAVLRYGLTTLGLNRVHASHFTRNPASGRVMQKIGMTYEGCMRQHILKWGIFEDIAVYGMVKSDLEAAL